MAVLIRPLNLLAGSQIRGLLNPIFITDILKFTVPVLRAVKAASVVIGKQKVQYHLTGFDNPLTHRLHVHSLFGQRVAGSRQLIHPLDLYDTQTAGTDLVYLL